MELLASRMEVSGDTSALQAARYELHVSNILVWKVVLAG